MAAECVHQLTHDFFRYAMPTANKPRVDAPVAVALPALIDCLADEYLVLVAACLAFCHTALVFALVVIKR